MLENTSEIETIRIVSLSRYITRGEHGLNPGACRSKVCAACGENPTITSMEASMEFASKHGLTVARVAPETADVPTATCQVNYVLCFVASR